MAGSSGTSGSGTCPVPAPDQLGSVGDERSKRPTACAGDPRFPAGGSLRAGRFDPGRAGQGLAAGIEIECSIRSPRMNLTLLILPGTFMISRLEPRAATPGGASAGSFVSVTRTGDELSIVCPDADVSEGVKSDTSASGQTIDS